MKRLWLIALACLLLIVPAAHAQETPTLPISPTLQTFVNGLENYARETRQLDELNDFQRLFPTRADAIGYILGLYEEEFTPEQAADAAQFYIAFDWLEPGADYLGLYLDLLGSQVGGFYEPETKQLNTILLGGGDLGDDLPLMEQIIHVHEYTHALQDQHFDLVTLQESVQDNPDAALALVSLIEGDAMSVTNAYVMSVSERDPIGTSLRLLAQGAQTGTLTIPPGVPPIIEAELLSPYTIGLNFVLDLYENGGWDTVNAAFANPPTAMSQVLHPQKYIDGIAPVEVTLADAGLLAEEWSLVTESTFGEFYLREYLKNQLGNSQSNNAAEGWSGDQFAIYRSTETDALAWVLKLAWENSAEADEFTAAFAEFGTSRFADAAPVDGCWSDEIDALCIAPDGDSHILAQAPTLELAQALIASQQ